MFSCLSVVYSLDVGNYELVTIFLELRQFLFRSSKNNQLEASQKVNHAQHIEQKQKKPKLRMNLISLIEANGQLRLMVVFVDLEN